MATKMYFEQTKPNKDGVFKRYEVVSFDMAATPPTVTLKGVATFTENFDKEKFKKMGYKLVQEEVADA